MATVRRALPEDLDGVTTVALATLEHHRTVLPAHFRRQPDRGALARFVRGVLGDEDGAVLVAVGDRGTVDGYALVRVHRRHADAFRNASVVVELDQLGVLPAAQGQGLGRALTAAVLDLATAVGATDVRLTVWTVNERAIRLYERMGLTARQLTMGRLLTPGREPPGRADGR